VPSSARTVMEHRAASLRSRKMISKTTSFTSTSSTLMDFTTI
jgi:hypothetical protein